MVLLGKLKMTLAEKFCQRFSSNKNLIILNDNTYTWVECQHLHYIVTKYSNQKCTACLCTICHKFISLKDAAYGRHKH